MNKIVKCFFSGKWRVLYKGEDEKEFKVLAGERNYWYADPFLFHADGSEYLFTEAFDEKKQVGKIAVSVLKNGVFSVPQAIISNPYHMSYPDVFSYQGGIFMLPETGEHKTLELYKAMEFPYRWERIVLLDHVDYADTTVFINDGKVFLTAYNEKEISTTIYNLDMGSLRLKECYSKKHGEKKFRPAGNIFRSKGRLYRPVQNCEHTYGGSLIINEIVDFERLEEEFVREIKPTEIKNGTYSKLHTLNRDHGYVVIDVFASDWGVKYVRQNIRGKRHRLKMSKEFS